MRWLLPAPPLQELKLGLLAFVCQRPNSAALAAAVRVSSTEGNDVLVLAPPREQETVERLGGIWRNMSSAELAVRAWTRRYRHMSYNTKSYEFFCFQRWLMLEYTLQQMKLPPEAAIAVLDDDVLLFRPPAHWLRELSSLAFHNESQTTSVLGMQAFRIHSKGSLQRFAAFLQWLYGLRLTHLASIIERFGHRSPLARLTVSQRRALYSPLLSTLTNSSSDVTPSFHHFSDIEAMHALCTLSKEGLIPDVLRLRCSEMWNPRGSIVGHDAKPAYSAQYFNCSTVYIAVTASGSTLQHTVETVATSGPAHKHAASVVTASGWVAGLHWVDGRPFAPSSDELFWHAICLMHLQGPVTKQQLLGRGFELFHGLGSHRPCPDNGTHKETGLAARGNFSHTRRKRFRWKRDT